ncbi:MAG: dTDP-glucose 4,6-dehydratase [Leptospiraceae bacterium]|nr:dTDP-glucose 4,6-dehydratase [Leptospiraceae bacterium]
MTRRILITGGAGFIGSNFVLQYARRYPDHRLTVVDKLTYAGRRENLSSLESRPGFRFIQGDLCDREMVLELVTSEDYDVILHMAAESHVDRSIEGPRAFIETNIIGTSNLLDGIRAAGWENSPDRHRFIHVSTDEVYGSLGPEGSFTEESPFKPNSPYSASKASADLLVRAAHRTYGLPTISTHCSNNFGPFQNGEKLIPVIIRNARDSTSIPVYGQGLNVRDWIYVLDHCDALEKIIEQGNPGCSYNIGANNEWPNLEIVKTICQIFDAKSPANAPHDRLIEFVTDRPGHDFRYAIDSTRMEEECGWKAKREFAAALEETVQWYLDHPEYLEKN